MKLMFWKKNRQVILFNLILLICFILGYGRFGDVIVDSFREAYIPEQVLQGKVLYKDIFTIYTPFAYLINAFLFFVFGAKLKVLYLAGYFASAGLLNIIFKLSSKFFSKTYALSIVLFIISAAALSPNVFNLFFPYSFGILYGMLFVTASLYCAIKEKYPLSYLFYSLALCSKYEFILMFPLLVWMSGRKDLLKNLFAFFTPILTMLGILYLQGLRLDDIIFAVQILMSMSSAKTLYWFYSVTGLVFRKEILPIYFMNFVKYFIPFILIHFFRKIWMVVLLLVYLYYVVDPEILVYAFPLISILFLIKFRKLSKKQLFVIIASLLISIKLFFALTLKSYGVYFLCFGLIPLYLLIPAKLKKALCIMLICSSLIIGIKNSSELFNKHVQIKTQKGIVYTSTFNGAGLNSLIIYLNRNTTKDDKVLILPECLSVNYLAERKSDNKFYSLIPLYVETFGENLIIKRLMFEKPKYIIVSNYDTSNYYYSFFGQDYAGEIYDYILQNYEREIQFGQGLIFNVFKLKE